MTIDGRGQPVVWPLTPRYQAGRGLHRRDRRARRRPTSGVAPAVLRRRGRWSSCRAPRTPRTAARAEDRRPRAAPSASTCGPAATSRPSRELYDAHVDEVRSAHNEEPEVGHAPARGRRQRLGRAPRRARRPPLRRRPGLRRPRRVPVRRPGPGACRARRGPGARRRRPGRRADRARPGLPVRGRAGRRGFHVLGDLDEDRGVWVLRPHRVADPAHAARRRLMAGLTVAVTGPTGEIGRAFIRSLERSREVGRIVGMARRPFDPAAHGWKRTEYRRGDVLDRASVEGLVEGADVVVHLAFVVLKAGSETRHVNVEGSRNVFEAAVAAGAQAAGLLELGRGLRLPGGPRRAHHRGRAGARPRAPSLLRPQGRGRGGPRRGAERRRDRGVGLPALHRRRPRRAGADRRRRAGPSACPARCAALAGAVGVLPDPGVPFQLVHHDDVATALRAGVVGRGEPGRLQPRGRGRDHDERPRRRARLPDRADARSWPSRRRPSSSPTSPSCPRRPRGSRRCAARCSWTRARRGACCAGARATTRRRPCA